MLSLNAHIFQSGLRWSEFEEPKYSADLAQSNPPFILEGKIWLAYDFRDIPRLCLAGISKSDNEPVNLSDSPEKSNPRMNISTVTVKQGKYCQY